jgi:hypothetical protein
MVLRRVDRSASVVVGILVGRGRVAASDISQIRGNPSQQFRSFLECQGFVDAVPRLDSPIVLNWREMDVMGLLHGLADRTFHSASRR